MSHNGIYLRIRAAVLGAGICLAALYAFTFIVGFDLLDIAEPYDNDRAHVVAWLVLIAGAALPCIYALTLGWRISGCVKRDRSFSRETARLLGGVSTCAFVDAGYFLLGNIVMLFIGNRQPGILLVAFAVIILALAAGMGFAALARFVQKAAELQEESDLTV